MSNKMEKQVLSVEDMKELISMGIDVSKAAMCWVIDENGERYLTFNRPITNKEMVPTFTLYDILKMLPVIKKEYTDFNGEKFKNYYAPEMLLCGDHLTHITYNFTVEDWLQIFNGNLLACAFDMLKWCKEQNYI